MIPGRNQNVRFRGRDFHVQTEDSDAPSFRVTTHIYVGGTIIASTRTSYGTLPDDENRNDLVKRLMEEQHDLMARRLKSGLYGAGEVSGRPYSCLLADPVLDGESEPALVDQLADGLATLI